MSQENILRCPSTSDTSLSFHGFTVTWTTLSISITDITKLMMTGTQIEKEKLSDTRMEVLATLT